MVIGLPVARATISCGVKRTFGSIPSGVAVGVNFFDVTQRNGAVPIPLPSGLGLEGAGRVNAGSEGEVKIMRIMRLK
jgi:hypothetical protein